MAVQSIIQKDHGSLLPNAAHMTVFLLIPTLLINSPSYNVPGKQDRQHLTLLKHDVPFHFCYLHHFLLLLFVFIFDLSLHFCLAKLYCFFKTWANHPSHL